MKKIKIGLLVISQEWGGAQEVVYQLANGLLNKGLNVSIFLNDELSSYYSNLRGLNIYNLGSINKTNKLSVLVSYFKLRNKLISTLSTIHVDLLHLHLTGSMYVCFGISVKFDVPMIFTLHGPEIDNFFERKSILDYLLLKDIFNKSKFLISPSLWQIHGLSKQYKLKTVIIPNGVQTNFFKPLPIKRNDNMILFVGRYVEVKGIRELIKIASNLPQYNFYFVGTGPLQKLINLPNTHDLGFKSRSELVNIYNEATICCFPSHHESMGIVGLEAISCGKAIIGTRLGFTEFIDTGKNGVIVRAKNLVEIEAAIMKLMEDKQFRHSVENGARKKALCFDWTKIIERHYKLYEDACNLRVKSN